MFLAPFSLCLRELLKNSSIRDSHVLLVVCLLLFLHQYLKNEADGYNKSRFDDLLCIFTIKETCLYQLDSFLKCLLAGDLWFQFFQSQMSKRAASETNRILDLYVIMKTRCWNHWLAWQSGILYFWKQRLAVAAHIFSFYRLPLKKHFKISKKKKKTVLVTAVQLHGFEFLSPI